MTYRCATRNGMFKWNVKMTIYAEECSNDVPVVSFFFLLGKRNVNLEAVHDVFYNCLQKIALKLGSLKQH